MIGQQVCRLHIQLNKKQRKERLLMIRNMTQYWKNLREELKEESRKKFYSNKKTLEDFTSACKGYKFPLTEADLFWLEDYMDSQLLL